VLIQAAAAWAEDEEPIDAAIRQGVDVLLVSIRDTDAIEYQRGGKVTVVTGTVTKSTKDDVFISTADGKRLSITRESIRKWRRAGLVDAEREAPFYTGPSTLAALALAVAGVETSHPKMQKLLSVLEEGPAGRGGTYVYGLRASLWSTLMERSLGQSQRMRYRKLLAKDVDWLERAERPGGWYTYTATGGGGDHSNTQFGNLGLWAGSIAKVEVANKHWQSMARHWLETQNGDNGWSYSGQRDASTASMTLAGCNSLYIALDRFYARPESAYRMFEGIMIPGETKERIREIHTAIKRGDDFLKNHPPDGTASSGYELFGLERLGLASGRAYIGGRDWLRAYTDVAARRVWGHDNIADAFSVIFLVHGQAPILFQKLEHSGGVEDWNYYPRDMTSLTRYINRTFERLHRWQHIPAGATLEEMEDAPILYIAGQNALEMPEATLKRIRRFIENGGIVFLHADRASRRFVESATRTFEALLADSGGRFEKLAESHPIYRCHFGGATSPWKRIVPLKAIQDGARLPVILCPVDIAGAWQQDRGPFEELFRIMANVRVYCAPTYAELPRRMRDLAPPQTDAPARGTLTLARPTWSEGFTAHPMAWLKYREGFKGRTGINLAIPGGAPDPSNWNRADIVHVSVRAEKRLNDEIVRSLEEYVKGGGLVLIDAGDGQSADIPAVRELVERMKMGARIMLPGEHPINSGSIPGGRPLGSLDRTDAGVGLSRGGEGPPIFARMVDGRVAVVACPFDLTAGLEGGFVWNRVGYRPESTRRIVDNILAWRWHELSTRGKTHVKP
jgi:hypothetical protein